MIPIALMIETMTETMIETIEVVVNHYPKRGK